MEQLAHGLRNDRTVSIMKLRGDSAATRLWLRAQLGVETFPAILGFPQVWPCLPKHLEAPSLADSQCFPPEMITPHRMAEALCDT